MIYEPMYEPAYDNIFKVSRIDLYERKDFYPDAQEMMPSNISLYL